MLYAVCGIFFLFVIFRIVRRKPSNTRNWSPDQQILPHADIKDTEVTIFNIRNFTYTAPKEFTVDFYDKTYNLKELTGLTFIVSPFSRVPGMAHTFLSFEFNDSSYLAISVEVRKQKGESFSALRSIWHGFEIMYVIADENDVIKLRTNQRKDKVYMYPIKIDQEALRSLFVDMLKRANELREKPEFYNLLTNTCTTNPIKHMNKALHGHIPWNIAILFPTLSDKFFHKLGLLNTSIPFPHIRREYLINERAHQYIDDPNFSKKVRGGV